MFPLRPGDKMPLPGTRGNLDATTDPNQIKQWWLTNPTANIGIALAPSGLTVLDIDVGPNKGGYAALKTLHAAHPITDTLTAITGGGGMHVVYSRPEDVPAKRKIDFLHRLIETEAKGSGLDLLGDGYIVAAPSLHKSGRRYQWQDATKEVAPLPATLSAVYSTATPTVEYDATDTRTIGEGGRDNALFRLGCSLRDTGITEEALKMAIYAENQLRCNPPLEDHEIDRIVYSVMARVVPTRDVLADAKFAQTVLPKEAQAANQLALDEGRISYGADQLADMEPPVVTLRATGIPGLEIPERDLSLLVAPPGSGKSAMALTWCMQPGVPSLYVSTELDTAELRARIVAQELQCPWLEILRGRRPKADIRNALAGKQLRIIGSDVLPGGTLQERLTAISEEILQIIKITGFAPTVAFDYVQDLARGVPKGELSGEGDPVGIVSRYLRTMAKWSGCPITMVSSTSRGWYGSHPEVKHPTGFLGTAKNSGDLEFDANLVVYLDLLEEARPDGSRPGRICVAKQRHGKVKEIGATFWGAQGGLWRHDESALQEFSKDHQVSRAKDLQLAEDDDAVLKRISNKGPDPISLLQHNCGIPATRAKRAVYRLLQDGRLEARKEARTDVNHRTKSVDVVGFPAANVAQGVIK